MEEVFLQELNAITAYANNSNTDHTESNVRKMLKDLLDMSNLDLYGNRSHPYYEANDTKNK